MRVTDMNLKKYNTSELLLIITTVFVVVGALAYVMIIEPQLDKRKTLLTEMQNKKLELTRMRAEMHIKDRVENTYIELEPLIMGNGTDQQEISQFSRELNDLYSRLRVSIRSVRVLPLLKEEHYRKVSIRTEMTGNIRDIVRLIGSVETGKKPVRIEHLNITAADAVDHVKASFLLTKVISIEKYIKDSQKNNPAKEEI